jgi:heme exporter protein CcmD
VSDHLGFVVAAYAVAFVVLVGMIAGVLLDYRAQRRALRRLGGRDGAQT